MQQAFYNDVPVDVPVVNPVAAEPTFAEPEKEYAFEGFTIDFNEKIALIPAYTNKTHG